MSEIIRFSYHRLRVVLPPDTSATLFFFAPSFSAAPSQIFLIFFSYHDIVHHSNVSRAVSFSPGLYPKLYFSVCSAHFISSSPRYLQTHISKSSTLFLYSACIAVYTLRIHTIFQLLLLQNRIFFLKPRRFFTSWRWTLWRWCLIFLHFRCTSTCHCYTIL